MTRRFGFLLLAAALLGAAVPVLAVSEAAPDDLEHNRRLLERDRADPDHYARLLRDLRAFQALPPDRQAQMRRFDHALHEEDPATQKRLWAVLERYAEWVGRLPEADQQRIDGAADPAERLRIVKDLREQQWVDRLPKADRDALAGLGEPARATKIASLLAAERQRRKEWQDWAAGQKARPEAGPRTTRPARLADFPEPVRAFVGDKLTPMLGDDEKERLKNVEGKWPALANLVADLAAKHPYLPPLPSGAVVRYDQLPAAVKALLTPEGLRRRGQWDELQKKEGKWPQYALAVTELLKQEKKGAPPLGASGPDDFPREVRTFLDRSGPEWKEADRARLHDAEGKWPDYPLALLDVARKNDAVVPGMSLPGPRELWNNARAAAALPDVPDRTLLQFAKSELTPAERAALHLGVADKPERLEILKEEYFKRHPDELQRLRRLDRRPAAGGS